MDTQNEPNDPDKLAREDETLASRHRILIGELDKAERDLEWWDAVILDPRFRKRLESIEDGIESTKEHLVNADKADDIRKLQADIRARRALVLAFKREAFADPVSEARKALRAFEEGHSLFLQRQRSKIETKAAKKTAAAG